MARAAGSFLDRTRLRLMCGTAALCAPLVFAGAAYAQSDLEARVKTLEQKLDQILNLLSADPGALAAEDAAALQSAGDVIREQKVLSGRGEPARPRLERVELDTPGGVSAQRDAEARPAPKPEDGFTVGDTTLKVSGYVKLDASTTRFTGGELPSNSLGRDFYLPALVPVGGEGDGADFDFNPRETRYRFDMKSVRGGHEIGGRIELDFQVTSDGNERVSNSFTPRIRQGYFTIDNWLFGQDWSTFQDVAALPDNLDFIGPAESTVFERQPLIRYSRGPFQVAVEQPETTIADLPNAGARVLPGDDFLPDFVVRYNRKRAWGHMTVAGIARALHVEEGTAGDTAVGYGVSVSGKVKVGARDDVRFMATAGEGIGRYIGLNLDNDAFIRGDGELGTIATYTGFASYRHF